MIRLLLAALLVSASSAFAEPRLTGSGEQILRNATDSGGAVVSGGGMTLSYAVGESLVASASGGAFRVEAGLVPMLAQPGTVTSIVAVSKSTGTLDLAWTAPGRDGALGSIAAGYWRIDYSSEPAHAFAPTTYAVELATSVAPGQAQSYQLAGLVPNTTYYTRIYLADAAKSVAETSAPSAESTYARTPIAPTFTGVHSTSVTISWMIPADGAAAFGAFGSSTSFGPGTALASSRTANGVAVTLTVKGLAPDSDYFFKLGSFNWQSEFNYDGLLSARTLPPGGGPVPPEDLEIIADSLNRTILLTWTNPGFANRAGVTVLVSTSPITFTPVDGTSYPIATVFGDGSVVRSSAPTPTNAHYEANLQLNVTAYFSLFSRDSANTYSLAASTQVVLDLPPMGAAGLTGSVSPDGATMNLSWARVTSNMDGSSFRGQGLGFAGTASAWEMDRLEIWRSTGVVRPTWTYVGTATATATTFQAPIPVLGGHYFYKVVARDAFQGNWTDQAMVVDTYGALYALGGDGVSRLRLSPVAAQLVTAAGNASGQPLLIRAKDRPSDLGGRVVKSVNFEPVSAPFNASVPISQAGPDASVVLRYETSGGLVVPSAVGAAASASPIVPAVTLANAPTRLSAYYMGSNDGAKLFGRVDPVGQTVALETGMLGNYQIRTILRDQEFSFDISGVSNKVLTPNGDGLNDTVVFTFDNPKDSEVSGQLFDTRGAFVADMRPGPLAGFSLIWDAKAGGVVVPQGVYIYQIKAEGKVVNGTLVIVR